MKFYHRDFVEVPFLLPNNKIEPHPAIIISVDDVYETEEIYYCIMCSTKQYGVDFEFELTPDKFIHITTTTSYVKCQLISMFFENEIIKRIGSIKKDAFDDLMRHMGKTVFGI